MTYAVLDIDATGVTENNKKYKKNLTLVISCLFMIFNLSAIAQTMRITGTIRNNREILQDARVRVKQTGEQVTTDADGRYGITVDVNAVLQISAKGHQQQNIPVNTRQTINVTLVPDSVYFRKLLVKKIKEIEPYAHFLQAEKQAVIKLTPAYYAARQAFVKELYFDHPHVQDPHQALDIFLKYCKGNTLLNQKAALFAKAARTLGFELITDASPVNMEDMLSASTAYRNIPYTTYDGYSQKLDLFLPKTVSVKPVPCIVFMHDGGWAVHKRAWFEAHARYMASKGYATVNIDYRMLDAVTPLQCVYDAKAAVRWVKANGHKFNIDTNKIGACGASAGAHLAAILATTNNDPALEGNGSNLRFSSRIQAAAGFATPTLTGRKTWPITTSGSLPDWFEKVSPYQHVTPGDAPMLFIHGSADDLVDVQEAIDMYKLYQKNGILTKLEIREGKGHVFYMDMTVIDSAYAFFKQVFN
jgi:acetyl esterase/lipase